MKRVIFLILAAMLAFGLAACGSGGAGQPSQPVKTQSSQTTAAGSSASAGAGASAQSTASLDPAYEFEFEDVDGNIHKLSDYAGKPVYIEIWGTWCSVCMASLPDLDAFAGEDHDFTVLSVVTPGVAGEKSKEDFIKWYKDTGNKNLIVLLDENSQILNDFGISAFPSELIFDSQGRFVTGFAGLMEQGTVEEIMKQVGEGTYQG